MVVALHTLLADRALNFHCALGRHECFIVDGSVRLADSKLGSAATRSWPPDRNRTPR